MKTRSTTIKILSLILAVVLCVSLVPGAAFAVDAKDDAAAATEPSAPAAEPAEAGDDPAETTPEPAADAVAFRQRAVCGGVTVSVTAGEGVFPEGAALSVRQAPARAQRAAAAAIESERSGSVTTAASYTFDIQVLDADGNELQPADGRTVTVAFSTAEVANRNLDVQVYHISDAGDELSAAALDVDTKGNTATVTTDGFSYYTVEFTYGSLQYVMPGDSTVPLADILSAVGLTGTVTDVAVSNDNLFSVSKKVGGWYVTAHEAFTSREWLKVTIGGVVYEIVVTDAIPSGGVGGTLGRGNGGGLYWFLNTSGKLVIRPTSGNGWTGGNTGAATLGLDNGNDYTIASRWPWHNYRADIKEVEVLGDITVMGNVSLSYMFQDCTNLTKVNLSKLKAANAKTMQYMFQGCTNLEEVILSSHDFGATSNSFRSMFQGCEKLKKIDLSTMTNNGYVWEMMDMFNGCTNLEEVILNNSNFVTRASGTPDTWGSITTGSVQMQRMFKDCDNLKKVDMSNITIYGRDNWTQVSGMFKDNTSLEEVKFKNTKFTNVTDFSSMFQGCTSLTSVDFTGAEVDDAAYMKNMFQGCTSLETLDVSSFGTLKQIVNMDGFVKDCTSLKTLNIDKLDNSHIGPTSDKGHTLADDASRENNSVTSITGCAEYGRDLGLKTCTALKTLSAKNSNVWMCTNERGTPSAEYYGAANDNDVYYFTQKQMKFASDVDPTVTIDSKRDYVDIITDRWSGNLPSFAGITGEPPDIENDTNINNNGGNHLNTNKSGHLAPGVYTILDEDWTEEHAPMEDTYYRIAYINEKPCEVEVKEGDDLVVVQSGNNTWINTKEMEWTPPPSGSKDFDCDITITYENAAIDVNGKLHDVEIRVTGIRFNDLDKIAKRKTNLGQSNRTHDDNVYAEDISQTYYRTVLQATRGDGLILRNYARQGDPNTPWSSTSVLTGGAGMELDFTVSIKGAKPNTTFIFYADDLDVPASQSWESDPDKSDFCYDELPIKNVTYGLGGESFVLGRGNDVSTVQFAPETGLTIAKDAKDRKTVISTGSDPSTSWSEFTVKADATGAKYTWVSGIACSTNALRDTPTLDTGKVEVAFNATKNFEKGTLNGGDFDFKIEKVSSDGPAPTGTLSDASNDASGAIRFGTLTFAPDSGNTQQIYDPAKYYPGTSPNGNEHGKGTHNTFTYTYKVSEVIPTPQDSGITYDSAPHTVTIKITTPENDAEMAQGIKVTVDVDGTETTYWSKVTPTIDLASLLKFTNARNVFDLTVSKTVTGNMGNKEKEFEFTVSLTGCEADGTYTLTYEKEASADTLPSGNPPTVTADIAGTASVIVKLKHGQWVTIKELPKGASYTIKEADYSADGYTTSSVVDYSIPGSTSYTYTGAVRYTDPQNKQDKYSGGTVPKHVMVSDHNVAYTNDKEISTPTGVLDTVGPALAGIGLAAFLIGALLIGRRRRRHG